MAATPMQQPAEPSFVLLLRSDGIVIEPKRPVGRPPAPPSVPISIRLTVEQNNAYKAAGGAKWLKALLDKQIKKQK
jgi:hypothetical protein